MNHNLAYLWASRTEREERLCEDAVDSKSRNLPDIADMSIAPDRDMVKAPEGGWRTAPHLRAQAAAQGQAQGQNQAQGPVQGQNRGQAQGLGGPGPGPAAASRRVNTTNFPYWPRSDDWDAPIPPYFSVDLPGLNQEEEDAILNPDEDETLDEDETEDEESKTARREAQLKHATAKAKDEWMYQRQVTETQRMVEGLAELGTLHPTDEDDERWYGIRSLGEGSLGRAVLRVKVNDTNSIIDVSDLIQILSVGCAC
jgi:hypothetical protein